MANTPFQVKALYEYSSSHDDDLGFPNGQVITVTEEEDADWFYGEYNDMVGVKHQGLFPRNFVKPFEPETPPRPSRLSRSKKDVEPSAAPNDADEVARSEHLGPLQPQPVSEAPSSKEISSNGEPSVNVSAHVVQTARASDVPPPAPPTNLATKPPPSNMAKSAPPPVTEKAATSSFRDRINAFNKPAAAPVAPAKPSALGTSGGSGFIKKPFVAPPPSKNAYVALPREPPPQRFYRREEDPELTSQTSNALEGSEMAMPSRASIPEEDDVDVPKPTSLKDRIALLQKQQMEQAARHAEAGQKKEKPKRPPKKRTGSQELVLDHEYHAEPDGLGRIETGDSVGKQSLETPRDDSLPGVRSSTRSHKSRDATPVASPTTLPPRDFLSDGNDADQSGAGDTEDGDEFSTGRDDSDEKSRNQVPTMPHRTHQIPMSQADIGNKDDNVEEYDQDEEEVDPEVQRRMEIRERMAKMSGGMGLAGMFAPVGNVPMASKKQSSMSSDRKTSMASVSAASDTSAPRAPPVQILPMPGVQRVQTPEQEERPIEVSKVEEDNSHHTISSRDPEEIPDVEDLAQKSFPPSRKSTERTVPPPVPEDRALPTLPTNAWESSPSPFDRPAPPARADTRPVLSPTPKPMMSPSEGSESDDEMSLRARSLSLKVPGNEDSRSASHDGPPKIPPNSPPPSISNRPQGPPNRGSDYGPPSPYVGTKDISPTSPVSTSTPAKRSSRVLPIPGSSPVIPSAPQTRAPPPPPPAGVPPSRVSTGDRLSSDLPKGRAHLYIDEEVTEYEGDYDTDMAPGATHKEALRSHSRISSQAENSMTDEANFHHPGLPSLGPPVSAAPRAVPPPPPSNPPKNFRLSSEMTRAPPPPPPVAKEQSYEARNNDLDSSNPALSRQDKSPDLRSNGFEDVVDPVDDDPENLYSVTPPRQSMPPQPSQSNPQHSSSSTLAAPNRNAPRQSLDVQRPGTGGRRSTDAPRQSSEQGFIANDIDLGQASMWWTQSNVVPPALQNRRDLLYEIEETSTTRRGGKQAMNKTLYVLYMDYSQTIISAHYETRDPSSVNFEQRHEPPPSRLRQDQLEEAYDKFGSRIEEAVHSRKDTVVGDGTPQGLILDLFASLPDALPPVGVRAYGALVYINIANASVQQFDEIRSGDIITFRSSKFQGHRGTMKSKYSIDVGKPDHVGIVVDWDGTRKKVRAWEQGRESKKVRMESFKIGDMRSGEVKVWRVMARNWVNWEGQS